MPQVSYSYPADGIVGQIGTYSTADVIGIENPLRQQLTNWDVNGATADGTYTLTATDGRQTVAASFAAVGQSAAQIAAGVAAAILAQPSFAGVTQSAVVVATDQVDILFQQAGLAWTVTHSAPNGTPTAPTVTTTAGYAEIAPGIILQSSNGGFTTTYTDARLAYGVTVRNADLVQPLSNPAAATGYDGPTMISLVRIGDIVVQGVAAVAILKGQTGYFDPSNRTWSNTTTGSSVLVEGSMFMGSTTGGRVRVHVSFPGHA